MTHKQNQVQLDKLLAVLVLSVSLGGLRAAAAAAPEGQAPKLPYTFEQNRGQAPSQVRFLARGEGYTLYLTDRESVLTLPRERESQRVIRMSLPGSRQPDSIAGLEPHRQKTNYLIGNDKTQWQTDVPHFSQVRYRQVYKGIDLIYHSAPETKGSRLEYDFVVSPGADPSRIQIEFQGADAVRINAEGELELLADGGVLMHRAPIAYQLEDDAHTYVKLIYEMRGRNRVGFRLLSRYDKAKPLLIDPVVIYSTMLGGQGSDSINAVAADAEGNTYLTGETTSGNFPIVGSGITPTQGAVVYSFVTKINPQGNSITYSSFLGGSSNTRGYGIAVDGQGNAYVAGVTGARNFPLVNPTQSQPPSLNLGYVAKINPAGNGVLFSTYLGGERNDEINGIALDPQGNIHVAGRATSAQIPLANAMQPVFGGNTDLIVAKFRAGDYRLVYATYFGKANLEYATAVTADAAGATYVTGLALGADSMATLGAAQNKSGGSNDAFVAKFSPNGQQLEWFTYFGGSNAEEGRALALDGAGHVWIGGSTYSANMPVTPDAIQPAMRGDTDAFFARIHGNGTQVLYSSYLGSTATRTAQYEEVSDLALDNDHVYLAGTAVGADFPSIRSLQAFGGAADGFVAAYSIAENKLEFSTPLGGGANDFAQGLAVDRLGFLHVGGQTLSNNFPLKAALRSTFAGQDEAFLTKICDPHLLLGALRLQFVYRTGEVTHPQNLGVSACTAIPFSVQVNGPFLAVDQASGITNATEKVSVNAAGLAPGEYAGTLVFTAPDAVNPTVTVQVQLTVAPPKPRFTPASIRNGASGDGGLVSPYEVIVIYGENLGPEELVTAQLDATGKVATLLQNTRVYFDGVAAPLVYTYKSQLSAIVPASVAGKTVASVEVEYLGSRSDAVNIGVTQVTPGIFTLNGSGLGTAAALHPDYSVNGPDNPAPQESTVILYATGGGMTDPMSVDGALTGNVLPKPLAPVTVTVGGQPAIVDYAGAAPGQVTGVLQMNVRIPAGTPPGAVELIMHIGSTPSISGVVVWVK